MPGGSAETAYSKGFRTGERERLALIAAIIVPASFPPAAPAGCADAGAPCYPAPEFVLNGLPDILAGIRFRAVCDVASFMVAAGNAAGMRLRKNCR